MELETISVRVCRDCGGRYTTPGVARLHKCQAGPGGNFKTVKETREKAPSRISYQPGYGPTP
jgi:hypothetical protein